MYANNQPINQKTKKISEAQIQNAGFNVKAKYLKAD